MRKKMIAVAVVAAGAMLAVVAGRAVFFSTRTSIRRAERSVLVEAPPEVVLAQLTDPRRWAAWSPWESRDPGVQRTYGGPAAGEGASSYWSGGAEVGAGRLTIIRAGPEKVEVEREIERPTWSLTDFEFRLSREGGGTRVWWSMKSEKNDLASRVRGLLPGRDEAIGEELERGLARLEAVAEAQARGERWRVERSALVAAPPPAVLARIADLHQWTAWSPWERPGMRRSYGGPPEGEGASYYFSGGAEAERGRLTVVKAAPGGVAVEMEIEEPRASLADLELRLVPEGDGTRLTWVMSGEVEVRGEALGRAGDPEATVGADLEKGLARLRAVVEAPAKVQVAR